MRTDRSVEPKSAAERQEICSPWREPWDESAIANQPRQGRNRSSDVIPSFADLRLSCWHQPIPTAYAVGYRSFAAERLCFRCVLTVSYNTAP